LHLVVLLYIITKTLFSQDRNSSLGLSE